MQYLMAQIEAAQRHAQFLGYSTYGTIIVCAIFSILIFWKLCHIKALLQSSARPIRRDEQFNQYRLRRHLLTNPHLLARTTSRVSCPNHEYRYNPQLHFQRRIMNYGNRTQQ